MERFFEFHIWEHNDLLNKYSKRLTSLDLASDGIKRFRAYKLQSTDGEIPCTKVFYLNGGSNIAAYGFREFANKYYEKISALENENPPSNSAN